MLFEASVDQSGKCKCLNLFLIMTVYFNIKAPFVRSPKHRVEKLWELMRVHQFKSGRPGLSSRRLVAITSGEPFLIGYQFVAADCRSANAVRYIGRFTLGWHGDRCN
jgi:hypothetical protein